MAAADADDTLKSKPVGTGPFVFVDYKPNEYFQATKNPNYWNQPYPYLDEIEFRPIPDCPQPPGRAAERFHRPPPLRQRRGHHRVPRQRRLRRRRRSTTTPRSATRCSTSRRRCPMARRRRSPTGVCAARSPTPTTSRPSTTTISQDVFPIANGPFAPGTPGHLDETGYPAATGHGQGEGAHRRVQGREPGSAEPVAGHHPGRDHLPSSPSSRSSGTRRPGSTTSPSTRSTRPTTSSPPLLGNFQAFQWRNHSNFDLDNQYIWWHSSLSGARRRAGPQLRSHQGPPHR